MRLFQLVFVFVIAMAAACGGSKQAAKSPGTGGAGSATEDAAPGGGSAAPDEAPAESVPTSGSDPCQGGE